MSPEDRIAELEEEVAYLRSELGLSRDETRFFSFRQALGLTPAEARTAVALFDAYPRTLTRAQIFDVMGRHGDDVNIKIVDVYACKLRKKLGGDAISTAWGAGYFLTERGRHVISTALAAALPQARAA